MGLRQSHMVVAVVSRGLERFGCCWMASVQQHAAARTPCDEPAAVCGLNRCVLCVQQLCAHAFHGHCSVLSTCRIALPCTAYPPRQPGCESHMPRHMQFQCHPRIKPSALRGCRSKCCACLSAPAVEHCSASACLSRVCSHV
jgi:hypothetical protein